MARNLHSEGRGERGEGTKPYGFKEGGFRREKPEGLKPRCPRPHGELKDSSGGAGVSPDSKRERRGRGIRTHSLKWKAGQGVEKRRLDLHGTVLGSEGEEDRSDAAGWNRLSKFTAFLLKKKKGREGIRSRPVLLEGEGEGFFPWRTNSRRGNTRISRRTGRKWYTTKTRREIGHFPLLT